jgi:hypothetical protein
MKPRTLAKQKTANKKLLFHHARGIRLWWEWRSRQSWRWGFVVRSYGPPQRKTTEYVMVPEDDPWRRGNKNHGVTMQQVSTAPQTAQTRLCERRETTIIAKVTRGSGTQSTDPRNELPRKEKTSCRHCSTTRAKTHTKRKAQRHPAAGVCCCTKTAQN